MRRRFRGPRAAPGSICPTRGTESAPNGSRQEPKKAKTTLPALRRDPVSGADDPPGRETAARLFEIINVLVVVLAIGIPLLRFLPKFLRKRSEKIRGDLETARKATEDANTRLSAVEAKLAGLDEEIAKFRAEVEQQIAQDEERIKAALEEESARIVASAEQEIGVAAAQAKRGLRHFAADLAIEQAAKKMVLTPETDRALIAEFVSRDRSRSRTRAEGRTDGRRIRFPLRTRLCRSGDVGQAGHGRARPAVRRFSWHLGRQRGAARVVSESGDSAVQKIAILDKLNAKLGLQKELRNLLAVLIDNDRIGDVHEVAQPGVRRCRSSSGSARRRLLRRAS